MRHLSGLFVCLLLITSCGRERLSDDQVQATETSGRSVTIDLPVNAEWVATGIKMASGLRIHVEVDDPRIAKGSPEVHPRATVPTYGLHGLVVRVGDQGIAVPTDGDYWLQGSTISEGEQVYIGRNLVPPDPYSEQSTASDSVTDETVLLPVNYEPVAYKVLLTTRASDAVALLNPIDQFYTFVQAGGKPQTYEWDQLDNAFQYSLDISDFRDFRRVMYNVNINTQSLNTATPDDGVNSALSQIQGPELTEGVYYWRVRAQINSGQLLSPDLVWTERSLIYRIGVEERRTVPPVEILTPASPSGSLFLTTGQFLAIEFSALPDASGLIWRHRNFHKPCGNSVNPDVDIPVEESVWQAFPAEYIGNDISRVPQLYGFLRTGSLAEGQWLIRIETKDGADKLGTRMGANNYRLTVGCQ